MKDMRRLSDSELAAQLTDARAELRDARFKLATLQLKNFRMLPRTRRKIAQLLTVMRERSAGEAPTGG